MSEPEQNKRSFLRRQGTLNPRPEDVIHESFNQSDFFDREDLLQVKYEMLRLVDIENKPVSRAAKAFGFSRRSFYRAQAAGRAPGLAGLVPQQRGPRSGHQLTPEFMDVAAHLRAAGPCMSSSHLAERIAERFGVS